MHPYQMLEHIVYACFVSAQLVCTIFFFLTMILVVFIVKNDNQDPKQIVAVHSSHIHALDQVPTNKNGGALT